MLSVFRELCRNILAQLFHRWPQVSAIVMTLVYEKRFAPQLFKFRVRTDLELQITLFGESFDLG